MKKSISILLFMLCACIGHAQNYVKLSDASGVQVSAGEMAELEAAATALKNTLPVGVRDSFKVYDAGLYLYNENMEANDFENMWQNIQHSIPNKYFLIFGRISKLDGTFEIKVNAKMPKSDCISEERLNGAISEVEFIFRENLYDIFSNEVNGINEFKIFLSRSIECCGSNRFSNFDIDTSLLKILVYEDACAKKPEKEHFVAIIAANTMPNLAYKIYYPYTMQGCNEVYGEFKVTYKRGCDGSSSTNPAYTRNDSIISVSTKYHLNDFVKIPYGTRTAAGVNWPVLQGGRATITLRDNLGRVLKVFKFTIKGINPKVGEVLKHLDEQPYSQVWFIKKKVIFESGSSQTDASAEALQFNRYNKYQEDLQKNWNESSRCPLFSDNGDCGMGLTQLTLLDSPLPDRPSAQALWDWKCNIRTGYELLRIKRNTVNHNFNNDWEVKRIWNTDDKHKDNQIELLDTLYAGITWKMAPSTFFGNAHPRLNDYFTQTLTGSERSLLDACVVLAYNGFAGTEGDNFLFLKRASPTDKPYWTIDDNLYNYVRNLSQRGVPNY